MVTWTDVFDNVSRSHHQIQVNHESSVDVVKSLVVVPIGQQTRDVIGCLSVKPWCYWL